MLLLPFFLYRLSDQYYWLLSVSSPSQNIKRISHIYAMGIDEKKRICTCSNVKKSACTTTMASLQNVSNCNRTTYRSHLSSEFFSLLLFEFQKHQIAFSLFYEVSVVVCYCSIVVIFFAISALLSTCYTVLVIEVSASFFVFSSSTLS